MPTVATDLAESMQWTRSLVGTLLVATVKSLPERASTLSALRLGAVLSVHAVSAKSASLMSGEVMVATQPQPSRRVLRLGPAGTDWQSESCVRSTPVCGSAMSPGASHTGWTWAVWARALAAALLMGPAALAVSAAPAPVPGAARPSELALPVPRAQGPVSLETALAQRRSQRRFGAAPLTSAEAGQLLWAAQGITGGQGERNAPSAGATYPLVLYLVAGHVDNLAGGMYRYLPQGHRLQGVAVGDVRAALAIAARGQRWIADAPALVVIAAQPARTAARYGARAEAYVAMEAGAAAQNLLLQAAALGLGGTLVGAFDEAAVRRSLALAETEQPLAIVPVGHRR